MVDLNLWDFKRWESFVKEKSRPLIGLAGNINYVIDIELLYFIIAQLPEYDFEIAGKIELDPAEKIIWNKLLNLPNVKYLGLIPYNEFPKTVINWNIGLVAAKQDNEYSKYLNNNKQYQYLAMGKPFVTFNYDAEYNAFEDLVYLATDKVDFVNKIKQAIRKSNDKDIIKKGIMLASLQSAENRAKQFLEMALNL
jgi:glycosyltransferase involved in cell wall biosynthesis